MNRLPRMVLVCLHLVTLFALPAFADDRQPPVKATPTGQSKVKRLLLLGQAPDGHPWSTHEYMAAGRLLASTLQDVPGLQTILVKADEPWKQGPELLDAADGVVVFLSEGAKWIHQQPARLAALKKLARRGGGFTALHWGMGCKKAEYIDDYVKLFGGCHGGPDRRYKVVTVRTEVAAPKHAVMRGISAFDVKEEFYYTLKFAKPAGSVTPLLRVPIDGKSHTVAWAWQRPDTGRSFGFSGCHYHENWRLKEYRRMVAQGILWTLKLPIPEKGLSVDVSENDLKIQRPKTD